jgi:hypothetical protein
MESINTRITQPAAHATAKIGANPVSRTCPFSRDDFLSSLTQAYGLAEAEGLGDGDALGLGDALDEALGDGLAVGEALADALGDGLGTGDAPGCS